MTAAPDIARDRLRALLPGLRALPTPAPERDHPAVAAALTLTRTVRDRNPDTVAHLLGVLTTPELAEVALALAAMVRPDTDPFASLAWLDLPAQEWSDDILAAEYGRWVAGERDATARDAHDEHGRRNADTEGAPQ
ncbi:MAG TPA: hypothetical protein VFM55_19200 [Micromonosporaceae bacterium]|nr:hypothetical protein [Micromonosporaceae bacterium]